MKYLGLIGLLFLVLGVFSGCAGALKSSGGHFIYFDGSKKDLKAEKKPETILIRDRAPAGNFRVIGMVEAVATGPASQDKDLKARLFKELQLQAALMNADGIYGIQTSRFDQTGAAMHATATAYGTK